VNKEGSLQLTYLASYENVYPVKVWLPGCKTFTVLDPKWGEHSSEEKVTKYSEKQHPFHRSHSCFDMSKPAVLTIQATEGKFKLIRVIGC
jgi:hypothetical protein